MRLSVDHNLGGQDLVPALLALAYAEDVAEPLYKALGDNAGSREPIPERWMGELVAEFSAAGLRLDTHMAANVDRLLFGDVYGGRSGFAKALTPSMITAWQPTGRRKPVNLLLSQGQIDELQALIRAHYRVAITAGGATEWGIDAATERRWKALGVLQSDVNLAGKVGDSFVAGRLAEILEDGASLADMRRMAKEFPMSREASLTMQALQDRVRFDLSGGIGYRAEQEAGRLMLGVNGERVQDIIAAYRSGQLKATPTNREKFSPEAIDALGEDRAIGGWRGLARELRNRMAQPDRARDWERVAVSSLRQSANVGAIQYMAEQKHAELWYDVHPKACAHCKRVYLEDDGTPRIFLVDDILEEITTSGGANYGRRAADYQPTALLHPFCQCRPKRKIEGVSPKGRIQAPGAPNRS